MPKTLSECRQIVGEEQLTITRLRQLLDETVFSEEEMVALVERCFTPRDRRILETVLGINGAKRHTFDQAFTLVNSDMPLLSRHQFEKVVGPKSLVRIGQLLESADPNKNPVLEKLRSSGKVTQGTKGASELVEYDSDHFAAWCSATATLAVKCPVEFDGKSIINGLLHEISIRASYGSKEHIFVTSGKGKQKLSFRTLRHLSQVLPAYGFTVVLDGNATSGGSLRVSW